VVATDRRDNGVATNFVVDTGRTCCNRVLHARAWLEGIWFDLDACDGCRVTPRLSVFVGFVCVGYIRMFTHWR